MGNNNGNNPKIVVPAPIMQMKITLLSNRSLVVNGIPVDYDTAMEILAGATKAVAKHFILKAKEGELDEKNNIIPRNIIIPNQII